MMIESNVRFFYHVAKKLRVRQVGGGDCLIGIVAGLEDHWIRGKRRQGEKCEFSLQFLIQANWETVHCAILGSFSLANRLLDLYKISYATKNFFFLSKHNLQDWFSQTFPSTELIRLKESR